MALRTSPDFSAVEAAFIDASGRKSTYDGELIPTVEVENIYGLGKLVALRFLEWVRENPCGLVALPTGRTPEYFIKTLELYKSKWEDAAIQAEVASCGLRAGTFPDTTNLTFVMLDEFFPMLPSHKNSFVHYVNLFYIGPLGIKSENVMSFNLTDNEVLTAAELDVFRSIDVDLSLLGGDEVCESDSPAIAQQRCILHKVRRFCDGFESRLEALGGIGFFLGGIGPDGHIAFNQEGSAHDSTTRLVNFNYPTAAAAAGDLGGIEIARGKAAMTIGVI